MKIYVATQFENKNNARRMMRKVRTAGHKITYDWTYDLQKVGTSDPSGDLKAEIWQEFAKLDALAVASADALVVLSIEEGGRGVYTELGIGIANNIPTIIIGPYFNNIFYFMPNCVRVKTMKEAMELISDLSKNNKKLEISSRLKELRLKQA